MFLTHKMFLTELLFLTININLILVKGIDATKQSSTPRSAQFFPFSILKKDYCRPALNPRLIGRHNRQGSGLPTLQQRYLPVVFCLYVPGPCGFSFFIWKWGKCSWGSVKPDCLLRKGSCGGLFCCCRDFSWWWGRRSGRR